MPYGTSTPSEQLVILDANGLSGERILRKMTLEGGGLNSLVGDTDGSVLAGGTFTSVNGLSAHSLVRLLPKGGLQPGFELSATTLSVLETAGQVTVTVQRTGDSTTPAAVEFYTQDNTAHGSPRPGADYLAQHRTLQFAPFEVSQTIPIAVYDDPALSADKTFSVGLTNPSDGVLLGSGPQSAVVTIVDDSSKVQFQTANYTFAEDAGAALVTVLREGGLQRFVSVDWATRDGSAVSGIDYVLQAGTLQFAPGEASKEIFVPILDNGIVDGDRILNVSLSNPLGPVRLLGATEAAVTIHDNERAVPQDAAANPQSLPLFRISRTDLLVSQIDRKTIVIVERLGPTSAPASVAYATRDGSARAGEDYSAVAGLLEFKALEQQRTIDIPVRNGGSPQPDLTFWFELSNPSRGSQLDGSSSLAQIVIYDGQSPGSLDPSFDAAGILPEPTGLSLLTGADFLAVQPDGKIVVQTWRGGRGPVLGGYVSIPLEIFRLMPDGSRDPGLNLILPRTDTSRPTLAEYALVMPDGKLLVNTASTVMRFNPDGSADSSFHQLSGQALAVQSDGKVLLARPATFGPAALVRLESDGSIDPAFQPELPFASIENIQLLVQRDGRIVLAAQTQAQLGGPFRPVLTRLNLDGSADWGFSTNAPSAASFSLLALQPDGKLLASGVLNATGYHPVFYRLNPDGTIDASFRPPTEIFALVVQPDGRSVVLLIDPPGGATPNTLVRLNEDGSRDPDYGPATISPSAPNGGFARHVAMTPDGQVLVAAFTADAQGRTGTLLRRFNGDGRFTRLQNIRVSRGVVGIQLRAQPGRVYELERSSDLLQWLPVTLKSASDYWLELDDTASLTPSREFYRVRSP
jgi:uncharacterized delta-60 repeat protein